MKKIEKQSEPTIKRSRAAQELGGVCVRTMRRYEIAGLLTPIKRNSRVTFYVLSEVEKLKRGEIPTPANDRPDLPPLRIPNGQFHREVRV